MANATFIAPVRVWGNANFRVRVGSANLFRYQHVGIPNAQFLHCGIRPTRGPNAKGFVLQWNIGLRRKKKIRDSPLYKNVPKGLEYVKKH